MKKNDYINYIESIQPEQGLKNRLKNKVLKHNKTKRNYIYFGVAAAACVLVMACILPQILNAPVQENLPPVAINSPSPVQTQAESPIPTQELPEAYSQRLCEYAYQVGEWIYFGKYEDGIYKINIDRTENTKISDEGYVQWLQVSDGWIYYASYDQIDSIELVKMRTDGSERVVLDKGDISFVTVLGDWIYYENRMPERNISLGIGKIYKMRTDGTEKKCIFEGILNYIYFAEHEIYYIDENFNIIKMQTDGTRKTLICDDYATIGDGHASKLTLSGEYIYYVMKDLNSSERALCRIKTDGTDKSIITTDNPEDNFTVKDNWIYYIVMHWDEDIEYILYKIYSDGTQKEKLYESYNNDICCNINVTEEWIYFEKQDQSNDFNLYKAKKDGTQVQKVELFGTQKTETSPMS